MTSPHIDKIEEATMELMRQIELNIVALGSTDGTLREVIGATLEQMFEEGERKTDAQWRLAIAHLDDYTRKKILITLKEISALHTVKESGGVTNN